MEEYQEFYSKVVLIKSMDIEFNAIIDQNVTLEIDAAYTIAKSVAVIFNEQVIGHLTVLAAKPVWMQLKFGNRVEAKIYGRLENGFENSICFLYYLHHVSA